MFSVGKINELSPYTIVVRQSDDPTTDYDALDSAVAQLNSWGRGNLVIDGSVYLDSAKDFTAPISLRGLDGNARIISNSTGEVFRWNPTFAVTSLTNYGISTAEPRQEYINITGAIAAGYVPASGQWIVMWSENTLSGMEPHNNVYSPRPGELHQVAEWNSNQGRIYVADFIVDRLTVSGKMAIVPMIEGVVVENLKFQVTPGVTVSDFASCLEFNACNNLRVRNIHVDRYGPGSFNFDNCANVIVSDITFEGIEKNDNVYGGVTVGIVNNFIFRDSFVYGSRHVFTTTAGFQASSPNRRYGTPLNVKVNNVHASCYSKIGATGQFTTRVAFDTHAEGWGIDFNNCSVTVAGDNGMSNVGIQTRSRNTTFRNCRIIGNYVTGQASNAPLGLRIFAEGAVVDNCYFEGLWMGIITDEDFATGCSNNAVIRNCTFKNMLEQGVNCIEGSGHSVDTCQFINCGNATQRSALTFRESSGHMVTNCVIPRYNNLISINQSGLGAGSITVMNNILTGYSAPNAAGPLGFAPTSTGSAFEIAYANRNHTGQGTGNRKSGHDALGNVSGALLLNIESGYFDNKTMVLVSGTTITPSGRIAGDCNLLVSQDDTGGRSLAWGSNVFWSSGTPPMPTGAMAIKHFSLYCDGSNGFYGSTV